MAAGALGVARVPLGESHGVPPHREGLGDLDQMRRGFESLAPAFAGRRTQHRLARGHDDHVRTFVAFLEDLAARIVRRDLWWWPYGDGGRGRSRGRDRRGR